MTRLVRLLLWSITFLSCNINCLGKNLRNEYANNNNNNNVRKSRPMPTQAQQMYADHEIMALIHFNMGTYFDGGDPSCTRENWPGLHGSGNPATFNPYLLDTDQWATVLHKMGTKHAVLTAKHGCGFLLWPSQVQIRTTDKQTVDYTYAVGRPGISAIQVDVLEKFVTSMRKVGMGVGFYYSLKNNFYLNRKDHQIQYNASLLLPGQVNVTTEDYETMALDHLRELWSNYGNLTEHWFDNGYTATIKDRLQALLEQLQPHMVVWRGEGITDNKISWVGTESGFPVGDDIWSTGCEGGNTGHPDAMDWCPKGCDTTLQNNDEWFYVPEVSIRSLDVMVHIYHKTVGRNGILELDVAVDKTGRIRYDHAKRYEQFGDYIRACYGNPLLRWTNMTGYVIDLDFDKPLLMDRIILREDQWQGGQRVRQYKVYVQEQKQQRMVNQSTLLSNIDFHSAWSFFSQGHSIGNKRIDLLDPNKGQKPMMVTKVRVHVMEASDIPWFREISVFAPCPHPSNLTATTASS